MEKKSADIKGDFLTAAWKRHVPFLSSRHICWLGIKRAWAKAFGRIKTVHGNVGNDGRSRRLTGAICAGVDCAIRASFSDYSSIFPV